MGGKVNIFADVASFLNLLTNPEFVNGKDLKYLIRQRADVFLIIDQEVLNERWNDKEDILRKLCDAYDIPCPNARPKLLTIFQKPFLCPQLDPFGIWMVNASEQDISRIKESYGVWMENPSLMSDDVFYLHHKREYEKDDVISGSTNNGWANYLEELSTQGKQLPPLNAVVINDRYLLYNTDERSADLYGFAGLNTLKKLFEAILPQKLQIPFHLTIYCQQPPVDMVLTDTLVEEFRSDMQDMRQYPIVIEFVYDISRHKRTFHSNYFLFDVDRTYDTFNWNNFKKLNGENYFCIESYHNDPYCSGDTNYITARNKIRIIKTQCDEVLASPDTSNPDYSKIKRVDLPDPTTIQNRLFTT